MRAILASLAMVGVAACQTGISDGQAVPVSPASDEVRVAFAVEPGSRAVTPKLGSDVIRAACVGTRPRFSQAPAVLAAMGGFVQDASTLIYFHQDYDLSVKLFKDRCSVVMGGLKNRAETLVVRQLAGPENTVNVATTRVVQGRLYVGYSVKGS